MRFSTFCLEEGFVDVSSVIAQPHEPQLDSVSHVNTLRLNGMSNELTTTALHQLRFAPLECNQSGKRLAGKLVWMTSHPQHALIICYQESRK